jgi:hypothetical protein
MVTLSGGSGRVTVWVPAIKGDGTETAKEKRTTTARDILACRTDTLPPQERQIFTYLQITNKQK